ncbi:MAG TPA: CARDB domain-containing protein, partial [Afifellaceae bacterium]|nr:CARDB domain-containing protein [Afifellaceae bacterium]
RGSCPDPKPKLVQKYENPAFPNAATVKFGSLKASSSKNHVLNFWSSLNFAPGQYRFTLIADAGNTNAESNEGNNTTVVIKTVP